VDPRRPLFYSPAGTARSRRYLAADQAKRRRHREAPA